jgi:8-oxo-dGTP pyrophosphatase MutT (NUDIX family)
MLFNEVIYRDDKKLLDFDNSKTISRKAVRAVIINESKILMVRLGKTSEYKFPGGGIEKNETVAEALTREVLEEVGCNVTKIEEKIGIMIEFGIAEEDENSIFKMISEYYAVRIDDNQFDQKLDKYEEELEFIPCWTEIEKAYKTNRAIIDNGYASTPWIGRETRVLEILYTNA